jgi:hypothetical protein
MPNLAKISLPSYSKRRISHPYRPFASIRNSASPSAAMLYFGLECCSPIISLDCQMSIEQFITTTTLTLSRNDGLIERRKLIEGMACLQTGRLSRLVSACHSI